MKCGCHSRCCPVSLCFPFSRVALKDLDDFRMQDSRIPLGQCTNGRYGG